MEDLEKKEAQLQERLARIKELEQEIKKKETAVRQKENAKKQVLLRLSPSLWEQIASWAEEDFEEMIYDNAPYLLAEMCYLLCDTEYL